MPDQSSGPLAPPWPYNWPELDSALDVETIELHGTHQLHRALNIKRLIAFVGSGVSMAYGRIAWSELARLHIDMMCDFLDDSKPPPNSQDLVEYLRDLRKKPDQLNAERLYAALQACEQIWRLTAGQQDPDALKPIATAYGFNWKDERIRLQERLIEGEERGSFLYRTWIKRETYDELPHARRLIRGWELDPPKAHAKFRWLPSRVVENYPTEELLEKAVTELAGARQLRRGQVGRHAQHYLVFFERNFVDALVVAAGGADKFVKGRIPQWFSSIFKISADIAQLCRDNIDDEYLRPVRAFAVGLALDLARLTDRITELSEKETGLPPPLAWTRDNTLVSPTADDGTVEPKPRYVQRSQQVPVHSDPLYALAYNLGIKRFLTTNYDLEIERLFTNLGFTAQTGVETDRPDLDDVEMVGPSGGRTRDFVLTRNSAVDLIDFAANDSPHDFQVVHLHGRATDYHDIVITEADYQQTYIQDTANETAFKEGIEIAFGGNPILFLGLSLGEGDILRPLREFMTGSSRRNRAVVALRDGRDDKMGRQTFAKTAYSRYGVHVIHYGRITKDGKYTEIFWLQLIHEAINKLNTQIDGLAKILESQTISAKRKQWNEYLKEISQIDFDIKGDGWSLLEDFESDGADCNIAFEVEVLKILARLVSSVTQLASPAWMRKITDAACSKNHQLALASFLRVSVRAAAERAETAIITAALSSKLAGIKKSWEVWWRDWRAVPKSRSEVTEFERFPRRAWGRHIGWDGKSIPTPPPALKAFLEVVPAPPATGRRVFTLVGARGSGKGNVFNAFSLNSHKMIEQTGKDYAGKFFTTFSFSIEIASVWDALIAFLYDEQRPPNLFLAPDRLYQDSAGQATMASIKELFERRLALAALPRLDALRRVLTELPNRLAAATTLPGDAIPRLLIVLNTFDVLLDENGEPKNSEIAQILDMLLGQTGREAPIDLVLMCRDTGLPQQYRLPKAVQNTRPPAPATRVRHRRLVTRMTLLTTKRQAEFGQNAGIHRELIAIVRRSGVALYPPETERWVLDELGVPLDLRVPTSGSRREFFHVLELPDADRDWQRRQFQRARPRLNACAIRAMDAVDSGRWQLDTAGENVAALKRLFNVHLERNRFLYTLVLAIADHIERGQAPIEAKDAELYEFLRRLISGVRGPDVSVQDRVVEMVIDYWFEKLASPADSHGARPVEHDPVLQETLLRHLAIIGTPVTAAVLSICPAVRRQLLFISEDGSPPDDWFTATVSKALDFLVDRRLIFGVLPAGGKVENTSRPVDNLARLNYRFVVHRTIQRYVFRKLGSQRLEPSEGQIFTVSLYTTQQRQFPRLNSAAYEFIYELVAALSAYPSSKPSLHETKKTRNAQANLASLALRAALGVTRNLFSIGVVSRLSDIGGVHVPRPSHLGYFEHHRLTVRWMFYYARHLYDPGAISAPDEWPPFYRDELAWLTNESGVFLHAQGQVYDAAALFWFARRLSRDIEGLRPGILRTRILLNDGWCSIDRARLDDAEARFRSVLNTDDKEEVLHHVAAGGLALIEHLRGRLDTAADKYREAIRGLERLGRSRPVAELQRNLGDLMRHLSDYDGAERELLKAVQIAEAGGYMELVHHAQVARVRNQIEKGVGDAGTFTDLLNLAQQYAEQMDLARLLCEVLMVRGLLLIRHGHSVVAGRFISRAIRIATLSGLSLRKIAYLELLARIERFRGGRESAERLRARTIQAAHNVGYNLVVDRAERARDELLMLPDPRRLRGERRHALAETG